LRRWYEPATGTFGNKNRSDLRKSRPVCCSGQRRLTVDTIFGTIILTQRVAHMTKKAKLLQKIKNNPKVVSFNDLDGLLSS
jgi:hypothetical protein